MSIGGVVRRNLYWIKDRLWNDGELYNTYKDVGDIINNRTPENVEKVQQRLNDLLEHAVNTTTFYASYKDKAIQEFPVINKQMVIEERESFFSSKYKNTPLHEMHTSGSTGIPFTIQQDLYKRKRVIAEIKAFNDLAEYPSHEKMLYILGNSKKERKFSKWKEFCENIYRKSVSVWENDAVAEMLHFLVDSKATALHASACDLYPLLDYINKEEISPSRFNLKSIISGGEMVPTKLRVDLENAFGAKCKTYIKYSNEEMGILGMDTGINMPYQLNVANYYFETLKMDSDEPSAEGEMGRIVVTDLFNYALPLIRYDTGDLGIISYSKEEWPILVELHGKRRDLLYDTKGNMIGGPTITNLLKYTRNIKMWQIIQNTEKAYTYRIVPGECRPTDEDILLSDIQDLFGEDAEIKVEYTDDIPTINSSKRQYMVNLYKPYKG